MTSDSEAAFDSVPLRRRLVFVGFTLVLLVLAAGLLAEVGYRSFATDPQVFDLSGLHEFRPDREWLYRLRPGASGEVLGTRYEINGDGFRGPTHTKQREPGTYRILVLGDSIAFGFGVREEQSFPRVLETQLASVLPQAKVEIVNFGTGGYSAWNEARLLEDVGVEYSPDLVLVQFSINDLNDPTIHFGTQTKLAMGSIPDEAFPDPERSAGVGALDRVFSRACHLSKLCTALRQRIADRREPEARTQEFISAFRDPVEETDRVEWRWLEERYDEMAIATEAAGARFAVLAFPYQAQVTGKKVQPVARHLAALAAERDWLFIDPLDAYRAARRRGARLFMDIWHPTEIGHRIAAQATLRGLVCARVFGPMSDTVEMEPPCEQP